jgi:hypothetical protein
MLTTGEDCDIINTINKAGRSPFSPCGAKAARVNIGKGKVHAPAIVGEKSFAFARDGEQNALRFFFF